LSRRRNSHSIPALGAGFQWLVELPVHDGYSESKGS
jgi:hypothetical protein